MKSAADEKRRRLLGCAARREARLDSRGTSAGGYARLDLGPRGSQGPKTGKYFTREVGPWVPGPQRGATLKVNRLDEKRGLTH